MIRTSRIPAIRRPVFRTLSVSGLSFAARATAIAVPPNPSITPALKGQGARDGEQRLTSRLSKLAPKALVDLGYDEYQSITLQPRRRRPVDRLRNAAISAWNFFHMGRGFKEPVQHASQPRNRRRPGGRASSVSPRAVLRRWSRSGLMLARCRGTWRWPASAFTPSAIGKADVASFLGASYFRQRRQRHRAVRLVGARLSYRHRA